MILDGASDRDHLTISDGVTAADIRKRFEAGELPMSIRTELETAAAVLRPPLAVRSSAVMEDSTVASWAGQFKSILGVQVAAVPRSILRCWSSLFGESVQYYSSGISFDLRNAAMAVIVQEMVNMPRWAGVAFTGTDLNSRENRGVILIEAVRGLGELLVSGSARAELRIEARLSDGEIRSRKLELDRRRGSYLGTNGQLPDTVVTELVCGARLLEANHEGRRVDIEWAWDGETLWFLQVRPIAFD